MRDFVLTADARHRDWYLSDSDAIQFARLARTPRRRAGSDIAADYYVQMRGAFRLVD